MVARLHLRGRGASGSLISRLGIDVEYRRGSEEYNARLRKLVPDLQKAAAKAVNETADEVLKGLVPVIEESLENPTEFTLDAMAATKARPGRHRLSST